MAILLPCSYLLTGTVPRLFFAGNWRTAYPEHAGKFYHTHDGNLSMAWVALVRVDPQRQTSSVLLWNNKWGVDNTFKDYTAVDLFYGSAGVKEDIQSMFESVTRQYDGGLITCPCGHGACGTHQLGNPYHADQHTADVCCRCPGQLNIFAFPAGYQWSCWHYKCRYPHETAVD